MASLKRTPVPDAVDPGTWRLDITGAVEQPLQLTRSDLEDWVLEGVTDDFTCEEGWSAPNLQWEGIPIEELLSDVRPRPGARWSLVHGMDGNYACALRLERLETGLLALRLDGERLSVEHGGPARLVLPGESDCWESVKWVSHIELAAEEPRDEDTAQQLALSRIED